MPFGIKRFPPILEDAMNYTHQRHELKIKFKAPFLNLKTVHYLFI